MTVIEALRQRTRQERQHQEYNSLLESLGNIFDKKINLENVILQKPLDILTTYLAMYNNIPANVLDNIKMVGSSEAKYNFPQLANLMDLMCLKPLIIHLLESHKNLAHLKITISDKEKQMFEAKADSEINFSQLLQSLLTSISSIENIVLEILNTMIPTLNNGKNDTFNTEFYYDCEYFASIIDEFRNYLDKLEPDEQRVSSHLLIYHWLIKQLNYHLISQTDNFAIRGEVLLPSINGNHAIENRIIGESWSAGFLQSSLVNLNLNYELFLRTLHCQTEAASFQTVGTNLKQIRNQRLARKIEVQEDWIAKLAVPNDLDLLKFKAFFVQSSPKYDLYSTALSYFLKNYTNADFEDIIIDNDQYISEAISAIEFSQNLDTYKELCQMLSIPCVESIEPSIVALIKDQLLTLKTDKNKEFSNDEVANQDELIPISTEMNYLEINRELKLLIDNLPEFIIMSNRDKQDIFKNELFEDCSRKYILQIIQILVNTKVSGKDSSLVKFLTLKNCLANPAKFDLPPKKAEPLNKIEHFPGRGKIPEMHIRIRTSLRSRLIAGYNPESDKILIIATDDHDFLK